VVPTPNDRLSRTRQVALLARFSGHFDLRGLGFLLTRGADAARRDRDHRCHQVREPGDHHLLSQPIRGSPYADCAVFRMQIAATNGLDPDLAQRAKPGAIR
jgi:hypothetical protein